MTTNRLSVALITEVFYDENGAERLGRRLREARDAGAELAALPELPLHRWVPATQEARDEDAEAPGGPRHQAQAAAARDAGISVLGGVIVRDPKSGKRFNTALLFARDGRLLASYRKNHIPQEQGFWEASHYQSGQQPPEVMEGLSLPVAVQICSDANRPQGTHLLRVKGAAAVFVPRATPITSYERWKLVLRANAVTSATYVLSINRPGPEAGINIGGPSVALAPDGSVLVESEEGLALVDLDAAAVAAARQDYPGYLDEHAELYARAWGEVQSISEC